MKKYYADKNSLNFLRVFTFAIIICIIVALKYLMYYLETRYPEYYLPAKITIPEIIIWAAIILLITAYVIFLFIILPMWYRSACYMVSPTEIIVKSGAIFKNTAYIKISAVQYTSTVKCPLSKHTSFNFLLINVYGGRVILMFLSCRDIEEIDKKIQSALRDRGGL